MAGTRKQVLQPTTWGIIMTTWTVDVVEEWIVIATKVDRALPPVRMRRVRAQCFYGIDTESLLWDLLNEDMKNIEPRFQPTNAQVSQWETVVLRWLPLLENRQDVHILWLRASGVGWKKICKKFHFERHTGMRRYKQALATLTAELNRLPQSKK